MPQRVIMPEIGLVTAVRFYKFEDFFQEGIYDHYLMECEYGSHAYNLIGTRKFQVHRK